MNNDTVSLTERTGTEFLSRIGERTIRLKLPLMFLKARSWPDFPSQEIRAKDISPVTSVVSSEALHRMVYRAKRARDRFTGMDFSTWD